MKHGTTYYLAYAANNIPEDISYSKASAPTGPFTYGGTIMKATGASFTNHTGIIDFNGHSYFFYHNGALQKGGSVPSNGDGYHRSVCLEEFKYNSDGSFPTIPSTTAGPQAIANLNPFVQTEAETIASESGVQTEVTSDTGGGMDVTSINNGDYIKVKNVDFGAGATSFDARVASNTSGGSIELHLDTLTGTVIGTCAVSGTGGAQTWATKSCTVTSTTGTHDLFLKFTGSGTRQPVQLQLVEIRWTGRRIHRRWRRRGNRNGWNLGIGWRGRLGRKGRHRWHRSDRHGRRGWKRREHRDRWSGTGGRGGSPGGTGGTIVTGTGGAAGSGATGSGGAKATGGVTGSGGLAATGGSTGNGGSSATGGISGTGGSGTTGSTGGSGEGGSSSGCSCQSSPGRGDGIFGIFALLSATILLRRREHRSPTAPSTQPGGPLRPSRTERLRIEEHLPEGLLASGAAIWVTTQSLPFGSGTSGGPCVPSNPPDVSADIRWAATVKPGSPIARSAT